MHYRVYLLVLDANSASSLKYHTADRHECIIQTYYADTGGLSNPVTTLQCWGPISDYQRDVSTFLYNHRVHFTILILATSSHQTRELLNLKQPEFSLFVTNV